MPVMGPCCLGLQPGDTPIPTSCLEGPRKRGTFEAPEAASHAERAQQDDDSGGDSLPDYIKGVWELP